VSAVSVFNLTSGRRFFAPTKGTRADAGYQQPFIDNSGKNLAEV